MKANPKVKLLLLTDGLFPFSIGGMQKHSTKLLMELSKSEDIDLTVVHTVLGGAEPEVSDFFSSEVREKVKFKYIPFPSSPKFLGRYIFNSWRYSKRISEWVEHTNCDFDYVLGQGFSSWAMLFQKGFSQKPIHSIHFHGLEMFQKSANFSQAFQFAMLKPFVIKILRKANYCFSLGGSLTNILKEEVGIASAKVVEIPNAISKEWLDYAPLRDADTSRVFLFVGRYERRKGIEELMEVIDGLKIPENVKFQFVGSIPESKRSSKKGIEYLGLIKDEEQLKSIYQEADVLLCPSWSEGMPTVILEAMALHTAVIATKVGAVEAVVHDNCGTTIQAGDHNELARAIVNFVDMSDEELTLLKENGRKRIEKGFSWPHVYKITKDHIISSVYPG